jgi:hypothetical protein
VWLRRLSGWVCAVAILCGIGSFIPRVRSEVKALVRPEEPPPLTPLAVVLPPTVAPSPTVASSATPVPVPSPPVVVAPPLAEISAASLEPPPPTAEPTAEPTATVAPTATEPAPTSTAGPVVVNGRTYDAYIPAASKEGQAYQYSCEFDAAWVIANTYGIPASVDDLIALVGVDTSIEPYIEETSQGFIIHGGNIVDTFSGDYRTNFLARSSGTAIRKAFDHYGLRSTLVSDRAGVEAALRAGSLVWIKTTVDFKSWRPATWVMPDGRTHHTVLGNDHAVVVMGFNEQGVVIRDVLGPTSSNRQRPYEYEVDWATFLASWEAQSFDGLAVAPPDPQ